MHASWEITKGQLPLKWNSYDCYRIKVAFHLRQGSMDPAQLASAGDKGKTRQTLTHLIAASVMNSSSEACKLSSFSILISSSGSSTRNSSVLDSSMKCPIMNVHAWQVHTQTVHHQHTIVRFLDVPGPDTHLLKSLTFIVTSTFNTTDKSFHKILQHIMMYQQTCLVTKGSAGLFLQ